MRLLIFLLLSLLAVRCSGQNQFSDILKKFPMVSLPIDSIPMLKVGDTLNVQRFNLVFWESQPKEVRGDKQRVVRPKVVRKGKLLDLESFGKVSESPMLFETVDGKEGYFYAKVFPVARVSLHESFITLIVKTVNSDLCYYDLYSFTPDGVRLSAVPLFKYEHNETLVDKIDYVYIQSSLMLNKTVSWVEKNRGLTTKRIYRLRDDGYFEIITDERTGKFEY